MKALAILALILAVALAAILGGREVIRNFRATVAARVVRVEGGQ